MSVEKVAIKPTYTKENGLWVLNTQELLPEDTSELGGQAIVCIPPREVAGNHKHAWREMFLAIGAGAHLLWQDGHDMMHEEAMNPDNTLYLFKIPSKVPHAVANRSDNPIVLYEYFDDTRQGVAETIELISPKDIL